MAQQKIGIIAGASGLVGKSVLHYALESSSYERIICLVRTKMDIQHPKLEQVITDFSNIGSYAFWTEADTVFCCIGTTMKKAGSKEAFRKVDFEIPKALINAAHHTQTQFHLLSSIGADPKSNVFYLKTKGEIEDYLIYSGIFSGHIYRPSLLIGKRDEFRFGEKMAILFNSLFSFLFFGPLKKYRGIKAEQVAEIMVKNSEQESEMGIQIHENVDMFASKGK